MPIRVKTVYDFYTFTRYHLFHFLRRSMLGVLWGGILAYYLAVAFYMWKFTIHERPTQFYLLMFALPLVIFLAPLFLMPFTRFKSIKKLVHIEFEFEFGPDGFNVH